jgi:hypothetical protein
MTGMARGAIKKPPHGQFDALVRAAAADDAGVDRSILLTGVRAIA